MTFCWHKWKKWETLDIDETGKALVTINTAPSGARSVVGTTEMQRRECEKCGKSQLRRVGA
jgi:hypothetical protein